MPAASNMCSPRCRVCAAGARVYRRLGRALRETKSTLLAIALVIVVIADAPSGHPAHRPILRFVSSVVALVEALDQLARFVGTCYSLSPMTEPRGDYLSRLQEYKQRLEGLVEDARGGIERQAPDVLDKMAATARNIAQRLDDMAGEARQRAEETEATPESAGTSDRAPEPADEPPASSGESGTSGVSGVSK
jgi:hypothetical protein